MYLQYVVLQAIINQFDTDFRQSQISFFLGLERNRFEVRVFWSGGLGGSKFSFRGQTLGLGKFEGLILDNEL